MSGGGRGRGGGGRGSGGRGGGGRGGGGRGGGENDNNTNGRGGGRGRGAKGRGGGRGRGRGGRGNSNSNSNSNNSNNNNNSNGRGGRGRGRQEQQQQQQQQEYSVSSDTRTPRNYNNNNNNGNKKSQLKNGEKGAEAHTVSESTRIGFTKKLMELREDETMAKMAFPTTLTNTERKFLHQLAGQLGLISKSTGKGENRHINVTKRNNATKKTGGQEDDNLPVLNIGNVGMAALKKHVSKFPPTHNETLESRETGASLVEAMEGDGGDTVLAQTLNQLGLGSAGGIKEAAYFRQPREKKVSLEARKKRHAGFQQEKQQNLKKYERMLQSRARLPAFARQAEIVATVAANPVTIIQGETGCGKSTQCPQFLLDAIPTANIVVTQPRRISAISIADRVAQEQCLEQNGAGTLIGYQVRLEGASSKDTQLLFVTPGILLRRLQGSPSLSEFTHIIIDEIHERDKYTEFLLIALRDLLPRRPDLRLILMSATLQTKVLTSYFRDAADDIPYYKTYPPAILEIEGRTFPVQEFFLEDILQMTEYILPETEEDAANGGGGGAVSMDQLEAEMAKLLGGGPGGDTQQVDNNTSVQCVMCGQAFPDHVALGSHVAICGGANNEETTVVTEEHLLNKSNNIAFNNAATGRQSSTSEVIYEDYDDYDVDATVEVQGYDLQALQNTPVIPDTENDDNTEKWDGEGVFQQDYVVETDITPSQESLLNQYQAMHDDEKVDTELLLEVMHYIHKTSQGNGAILVFLPGWQEISEFSMMLESSAPFSNRSRFLILPLHSGIPSMDQRKVLQRPPEGVRKIVLSTNIAETSLTIEDVSFVLDTGRAKQKDYDPHLKTSTLQACWVSQASSKQRKGRAGRTKAGVCFHIFSSRRYQSMKPFTESELLRTPLEEMCLFTKKLGLAPGGPEDSDGIPAFLSKAISPPHEKTVANALELLVDLGAMLPETNDLTNLGQCLSILSLEPRVGKMVIWSYILGCARVSSHMALAMSHKSPFVLPPPNMRRDAENAQVALSQNSESDQVTVLNAMFKHDQLRKKSPGAFREFCRRNFLSTATMQMISDLRRNLTRELTSLDFPDPMTQNAYHNRHDKQQALWQAAISAGLYPNIATRKRGDVNFSTMTNRKAKIHISSVNSVKGQPLNGKCQIPEGEIEFVCFGEMVKGAHFFTLSQTTHLASPLPLLLLCGTSLSVQPVLVEDEEGNKRKSCDAILNLDDWIIFKCDADVASRLVVLRKRLEVAFWNAISQPSAGLKNLNEQERDAVETLGSVLQSALKSTSVR